jgi:hypothetical protein
MNLGSFGGFGGLCYILAVLRGALRFLIKSSYLYNKKKKKKKENLGSDLGETNRSEAGLYRLRL